MKNIVGTLLLCATALCELPYPQRGFRPSPQFHNSPSKYHLYRPPSVDLKLNSKLTIEQLIGLTEKLQSSKSRPQINYGPPSTSYGVPDVKHVETFDRQRQKILSDLQRQQLPYRAPTGFSSYQQAQQSNSFGGNGQNIQPQQQYANSFGGGVNNQNQPQLQSVPQNSYVSQQPQNSYSQNQPQQPQNVVGSNPGQQQYVPQNSYVTQQPQSSFGSSSNDNNQNRPQEPQNVENSNRPQQQYVPHTSYVPQQPQSFFGSNNQNRGQQAGNSNPNNQNQPQQPQFGIGSNPPQQQYIPQQPQSFFGTSSNNQNRGLQAENSNTNSQNQPQQPQFGVSTNPPQQQYVPQQNQAENSNSNGQNQPQFGEGSNPPPQNGGYLPPQPQTTPKSISATTLTPSTVATTAASDDYDYDQTAEEGPNVAVSNAVAGAGSFFYLQQPDGRLQKVILQKTREPNSKPEEYVANYYFQNVQALPNTVYSPLINLAAYTQK